MNYLQILKKEWPVLLLLLAPFIISVSVWDAVPETVPTHFNIYGEADDFGPKWIILLLLPGISVFTYLALLILPAIDPKKRIENVQKPIAAIRIITTVFITGLYTILLLISTGADLNIDTYITVALGLLFFVIGNYLHSVKPNYFIGLRTPWALENETVWKKTHRLGSKVWMIGGLVVLISPLFNLNSTFGFSLSLIVIVPMTLIPVIYSYVIFKRIENT